MAGEKHKPVKGGAYPADDVARRVKAAWEALASDARPKGETLARAMGYASASAWTKRISPENKDWVPFRVDELSVVKPLIAPDAPPGWPLLDDTATNIARRAFEQAGAIPSAAPPGPAPASSSGRPARQRAGGHR